MVDKVTEAAVVGGVDTHKDLHVAAVVDQNNKVLGTQYFSTTRQGYRQMLAWMTSFGTLKRIGVECTGTYGSGLLRYFQNAGLEVLEVTAPDRMSGRCVGRTDTVELRCLGQRKCFGPTLERDPQRRLGNSARWPEQPRGNRRLGAPRRVSAKEHADEQGAAGTRLQREDRCLIEAPVAHAG